MDRAGTAGADAAPVLGPGHFQMLTEHPEQRCAGIDVHLSLAALDGEGVGRHEALALLTRRAGEVWGDPRACGRDEFGMRQRRNRSRESVKAAPRLKGPQDQRLLLVMP